MAGPMVYDRVRETTSTTGTGTLTMAGAVSGFRTFSVVGNGNSCYYTIVNGTSWEVGVGTYSSSGSTLSRDAILSSSNSNNAIDLSGQSDVFITAPAELLGPPGEETISTATVLGFTALSRSLSCLKWHVCTGTTSDYTVTLPATSDAAGHYLAIRMSPGMTKLVTLDGNGSEAIDGATTRIMWAEESAVLFCDGSHWFKVAGKSRAMTIAIQRTTDQTGIAGSTATAMVANVHADGTSLMWDSGNGRVKIVRPGIYDAIQFTYLSATSGTMTFGTHGPGLNSAASGNGYLFAVALSGSVSSGMGTAVFTCATNDFISAWVTHDATEAKLVAAAQSRLTVAERCTW